MSDEHKCPICAKPFVMGELCAFDIDMGECHDACLEGAQVVDIETGEPSDGPILTWKYGDPQ